MIIIIFSRKGLFEWEKRHCAEVLNKLLLEVRRFNKKMKLLGSDSVQVEIQIEFK